MRTVNAESRGARGGSGGLCLWAPCPALVSKAQGSFHECLPNPQALTSPKGSASQAQLTKMWPDSTIWERNLTLPVPLPNSGGPSSAGRRTEGTGQEPQSCTSSLSSATNIWWPWQALPFLWAPGSYRTGLGCTHMHMPHWAESARDRCHLAWVRLWKLENVTGIQLLE